MKALILMLAFFCIISAFSQLGQATPTVVARVQMKMNESYTLNQIQKQNETNLSKKCSYMVTIDTSCTSPNHTKDQINMKFADAYDNMVYLPRLDTVGGAKFERCSTAVFEIIGPCINKICKLFLFRKGDGGWIPEKVTAYDYKYPPVIFNYKSFLIPGNNTGYGFNFCTSV